MLNAWEVKGEDNVYRAAVDAPERGNIIWLRESVVPFLRGQRELEVERDIKHQIYCTPPLSRAHIYTLWTHSGL